jgi:hypothetical protein
MESAPAASPRRRPRRGSAERPVNTRLVRTVALLILGPVVVLALTVVRPGPLPAPTLPPAFDGAVAVDLTRELARDHPNRVPGTPGAAAAARWFRDEIALYGIPVEEDVWREDVPGLGTVELRNLVAVVRGTLDSTIVVIANRDNAGRSAGANENASGTAALVELARAYATVGTGGALPRRPLHTIVFASTDAGAWGSLGAARFATSPRGRAAVAGLVLDGLAGRAPARLELAGSDRTSPTAALVRTLDARLEEQSVDPARPGLLGQLVALGVPLGLGEQAPLLAAGTPAVRLATAPEVGSEPGADEPESLAPGTLARLGAAVDATIGSLDADVELRSTTAAALFLRGRALRGWALGLLLAVAVLPFAAAAVDLLGRCRRRRLPLLGAWRSFRRRLGFWLLGLVALAGAALAGALPVDTALPPRPDLPPLDHWPLGVLAAMIAFGVIAWLRERAQLAPRWSATEDEELAGWTVALVALVVVAALVAVANAVALVFLLPSLYAWLAALQVDRRSPSLADALFGIGFAGPVVVLVVLTEQLELGLRGPLYLAGLMTSGTVPWLLSLALAGWAAAAAQVAVLVAGRYAPVGGPSSAR